MIPKFRVWDKVNEIYFNHVDVIDFVNGIIICYSNNDGEQFEVEFESAVVMQSTSLEDRYGTEIYDKDIVRDSYGDHYLIEWLDGEFLLTDFYNGGYDHCSIDDSELYEVIGNKYEHPHLLGE